MSSLVRSLIDFNKRLSAMLDRALPRRLRETGSVGDAIIPQYLSPGYAIADVGGGKKPYLTRAIKGELNLTCHGLDIDADELKSAPSDIYDEVHVIDLVDLPQSIKGRYDVIICRNTLEHVMDNKEALANLYALLRPSGVCITTVPCRHALFAILNRRLPQDLKRRLLHFFFPSKTGDGFPAYYNRASPGEFKEIVTACGGNVLFERRFYYSSYFSVLFPLYALWRMMTGVQYITNKNYCENFQLVFQRP